ncbi:alpha/beta hydrolase [Bradyrhizobium sp. LHD-71]|uniref:alpha/beta fold hydrolase n=1 Tax=Bradyrhizobium sp. LHD-71 TaxID=3072141 RepID=UPI00280CF2D7|nr:alpha/beta hydrolase [Bradyrhizobium sp. LHD-71]MDQ8730294.1 alpha/beta hydrolase [Bradyrhizobium sp. LHD-71]
MASWHQGAVKLRYTVDGTTGPSLVLLHELGGSMDSWDGVVPAFEKDFRVLRYDLRGAGQSEVPPAEYSVENGHLADLLELLKATGLKPPYHFVGAAAGAMIAVTFALKYPDEVASLTLLAAALGVTDPARKQEMFDRTKLAMEKGMAVVTDAALLKSYPEVVRHDKARFERFRDTMLRSDPRGWAYCNYALINAHLEDRLGELRVPVQFLAGTHDPLRTPAIIKVLADKAKDAGFEEIDSGHFMHVQTPALVAAKARSWIDAHAPAGAK